jgi:choline-sulfatase
VAAVVLDASFGLDQGFATYNDGFDLTTAGTEGIGVTQHKGEDVAERAAAWLSTPRDQPFFAWVHLYDPHRPHQAPEPYASRFDPYAAEVAYADAQIASLLSALEGRSDVVVSVLSDHGEGNGDHGELTHGQLTYRSTMRIPWVVAGPGVSPQRLPGPASITDVAGTLLMLAGLEPIGNKTTVHATSASQYAESLYPRLTLGLHDLAVAQDDTYRLIDGRYPELFAWRDDPGELHNLANTYLSDVTRLQRTLAEHDRTVSPTAIDAETAAALASLGYMTGTPIADSATLMDPRDAPDMATAFEDVVVRARTRPPREGAVLLQQFLDEYPAVTGVRQMLVTAWEAAGESQAAIAALQPLIDARPDDPMLRARHAELVLSNGDTRAAIAELEQVRTEHPEQVAVRGLLAELYRREGRCDAAVSEAEAGLAQSEESSRLLLVRGACRRQTGRLREAEADLRAVIRLDPHNIDVHGVLGHVLADSTRFSEAAEAFAQQRRLTPERAELPALIGAALHADEQWLAALTPLEAACAVPTDAESRILRADALFKATGDTAQAFTLLAEAKRLAPTDRRVAEVHASILLAEGDAEAALRVLSEY